MFFDRIMILDSVKEEVNEYYLESSIPNTLNNYFNDVKTKLQKDKVEEKAKQCRKCKNVFGSKQTRVKESSHECLICHMVFHHGCLDKEDQPSSRNKIFYCVDCVNNLANYCGKCNIIYKANDFMVQCDAVKNGTMVFALTLKQMKRRK